MARKHLGNKLGCPRCGWVWQAAEDSRPAASDRWIGRRLGNYRLIRLLGRGTNGLVYEAVDQALDRRVAVKVLPKSRVSDPQVLQNLILEAREAARLEHPNTLRIRHVGADVDAYFVVSELIEGGSAADYVLAHGAMNPSEATRVVADAARALVAAHALGVVHRNIKPSNILCGRDGVVKLADFGLEKRSDAASLKTAAGRAIGSALFMSPEHFVNALLDPRSDIYSLGAVYFCLLTGRAPFEADTLVQAANLHLNAPVPDPRKLNPAVPAGCAEIVMKCLAKEPEQRFQSAEELLAALENLGVAAPIPIDGERGGPLPWSDFIAAQTGADADSIVHLPELDPAGMRFAAPVTGTASGRSPVRPAGKAVPAADAVAGPTWAGYLLPALISAVIVGLVLAVVVKVAMMGGDGPPAPPSSDAPKKIDPDDAFEPPPLTRNEQRETEAGLALEKLVDRSDRKNLSAQERKELIAAYEAFIRQYEGTDAAQNAVIYLRNLRRE